MNDTLHDKIKKLHLAGVLQTADLRADQAILRRTQGTHKTSIEIHKVMFLNTRSYNVCYELML